MSEPRGLPRVGARRLRPGACVEASVVHESRFVQVTAWRCLSDGEALRAERTQTHHVLTLLGTGRCEIEQGRWRTELDPCRAILHRPGSTYRTLHPHGHGDAGWSFALAEATVEELSDRRRVADPTRGRPAQVRSIAPSALMPQLVALQRAGRGLPVSPLALDELSLDLLSCVLSDASRCSIEGERASHRRLADQAAALAGARFRTALRLAGVAAELGCSPFHLCRVFKAAHGRSFSAHVRELRLGFVIDALARGHESLAELALEAGFASHAHLSDTFSRATGLPPSRVREALRNPASKNLKAESRLRGGD